MAGHKTFSSTFHELLPAAQVKRYTSIHAAFPVIASFGFQIHRSVQSNVWPYTDTYVLAIKCQDFCPRDYILNSLL